MTLKAVQPFKADPGRAFERANQGRVVLSLARLADRRGQRVAPGERVRFERRTPFVEAVEQVKVAGEVSADKIGYISIISCNINILHRMLCE